MIREYKDILFEVDTKSLDESTGIFNGYGSTFGGKPDSYKDIIMQGAFQETLEKGGRNGFGIAMLWQHNPDQPVGSWLDLQENKKGLKVQGKLTLGVRQADEALLLMKDKALQGLSIGYSIPKGGYEIDEKTNIRYIKKIDLWEISLVTFPANTNAQITRVKAIEEAKTERELEKALRDAGLSRKEALIMVQRSKPYLRQLRNEGSWKNVLAGLKKVNAQLEINNMIHGG